MRYFFTIFLFVFFGGFCVGQTISPSGTAPYCEGQSITLTVSPTTNIASYQWMNGGINIVGANSASYLANIAGTYTVKLTRTTPLLDTTIGGSGFVINPLPNVPTFNFTTNNQCASSPFNFTVTNPQAGVTYNWDFGDGNTGNGSSISHTYGAIGNGTSNFAVSVKATNAFGCFINSTIQNISATQKPDPRLGPTPTIYDGKLYYRKCTGAASEVFTFTNLSSTALTNASYKIIWGDATPDFTSGIFPVSHTFNVGFNSILFVVTGNNGCIDSARYYIFVGTNPAVGLGNPGNTSICTGTSLTFPISGTATNTPGTTYIVTFNDGSLPLPYSHPAPSNVSHVFTKISCSTTSGTYTNSFSATIQASNPCLTSTATVVPIYVSQKPIPSFIVSPSDTVCQNTNVTISNTSINNNYIDNGNCNNGNSIWSISPSTGWNIISGSLGDDQGFIDPTFWNSGSSNLLVRFTQTGIYTIKLKLGNPTCGVDSLIKTICVNPIPVANFTIDQNIGCAPLQVNTTNIPSANNCGNNTYNWSVSFVSTAGCASPSSPDFIYIGGTNANSINPKFQFNNSGVYTLNLTAISPGSSCSSLLVSKIVTVKGKPQASIIASASICKGQNVSPTLNTSCYINASTTYNWSFPGSVELTSSNNPPGIVTYNNIGTFNILVDVTNECGTTTALKPITINDVSVAAAGPTQNLCGSIITLAANTPTIGTGLWTTVSGPNSPFITNTSSPTSTVTGLIAGSYVFRWTISNGLCTNFSDVTINISSGASIANAGTDQKLCLNTSTLITANNPLVGTGSWQQVSGPNISVIITPTSNSTTVSGLIPGVYIFRWSIIYSNCTPNTDDVEVTIYKNPSIADAGIDQTICTSSTSLSANTPLIGVGSWSQIGSSPNAAVLLNTNSPTTSVNGLIAGNYKFIWTINNGNCLPTKDTVEIIVTQVPTTANAGLDKSACIGSSINLIGNVPTFGNGAWTIESGPPGAIITNPATENTTVTNLSVGTYIFRWTITNGICPISFDDVQAIIYDNPSLSNAGPDQTICAAFTTLAANTPLIGAGFWSQIGASPNTAIFSNSNSPNASVSGLIAGLYKFTWTISNGPCITTKDTVEINVTQVATVAVAGGDIRQCGATTIQLTANTAVVGTGVWSYVSGPLGYTITNTLNPNTSVTGLIHGTYVFRWTITNGNCPPSFDEVQVIIDENVTTASAGPNQNKCGVSVLMAANNPVVGTGLWTIISGNINAIFVDPTSATTNITGLVPGVYVFKWTITNGTCSSSSNVNVTIFSGASVALAGIDQDLCLANSTSLNAVSPTTGTGHWIQISGPNTAIFVDSLNNITTINGLIPGAYVFRWTVEYSNCTPNIDDVQVKIFDNPTLAIAGPNQTICAASTILNANIPAIGMGAWIQMNGPNTAIIADVNSPSSEISSLIPGIYKFIWKISSGPCTASEDTVEINVSAIATIANAGRDSTYCALTNITLNGNLPQVGIGNWSFINGPNTPSIINANSNVTSVVGLIPGNYTFRWTIKSGVCPPSSSDVIITILNDLQNIVSAPIDTSCSGQSVVINGIMPTGGNGLYLYQWQQSADGNIWSDIVGETNQNLSIILNVTTFLRRNVISLPCIKLSNVIKIIVQPGISNNIIGTDTSICINTQSPLVNGTTPTGGDGIYFYQWQQSINGGTSWIDIASATAINYNPGILIQTTKYRRLVSTVLCSGVQSNASNVVTIKVNPNAKAIFTSNPIVNCAPFNLSTAISVTALPDSNGIYNWYADGLLFGSNGTGIFPGYTIVNAGDTVDIKLVTVSQFGCKPDSITQQFVTVKTAVATFIKDTARGCGPLNVTFTNTSNLINSNIQFFWNFGNGITSNAQQPGTITFNTSPFFNDTTYQITLKAYNGCDTTLWRDSVKIRSNPNARFGVVSTFGCSPFTVQINNTSLGGPNTYYWDFGNGHKDTTFVTGSLNYTYNIGNVVDTLPIQLIAVNECGRDTQVINIRIAPNVIQPQINVNASDLFGCAPHIVAFNNATSGATSYTWNFDDGTPLITTNNTETTILHTFNTAGVYNVIIAITNGCSDTTATRQVTVYDKPKAIFTTHASIYCLGDTIKVTNTSLHATNYRWFWGDGQSSAGLQPTHVYAIAGNYTILLRAEKTNNSGIVCYDTLVQSITVLIKPNVTLQTNIGIINCAPFTLTATAPAIINEAVTWYINDTTVSPSIIITSGISTLYTFNKPGTFTIKMVAENILGCKDSVVKIFTVRGTPIASFTPQNISVCTLDTTINYVNTTTFNDNGPLNYRWLVNGTQFGVNGNYSHRYQTATNAILPKIYTTQLIASNTVGCSDTAIGLLQVNPTSKAIFNVVNPNACVPFTINVLNNSIYASTYKWLLNGVLVDTAVAPSFVISQPATSYTITLITSNTYGCKPDTTLVNFITRNKPKAAFVLIDSVGCNGTLSIAPINRTINATSYKWDWGDATAVSTFANPTHVYNVIGQYNIALIASDGTCADTAFKQVNVSIKPIVNFDVNQRITCDTARIQFINSTIGSNNFTWSFSNGTISNDINPYKLFAPSSTPYTVKLVAIGSFGCKDSLIKPNLITAIVPPAADFFISPSATITVPNYTFNFNNLTLNNTKYVYQWNLADGTFGNTRDISHKYADTGNYPIQLIVLDTSTNCPDTIIKMARIDGFPGWLYVPNAICPNCIQSNVRDFIPKGKGLKEYQLQIFTTWGELVFETKDIDATGAPTKPWDGRYKGVPVQQDVYVWKIFAKFMNGSEWQGMLYPGEGQYKKTGTITVVR